MENEYCEYECDQEDLIEQACLYLTKKTYPDGCTQSRKRQVRKKAEKFRIVNGELFYLPKDKLSLSTVYVPQCLLMFHSIDGEVYPRALRASENSHRMSCRSNFGAYGSEEDCGKNPRAICVEGFAQGCPEFL